MTLKHDALTPAEYKQLTLTFAQARKPNAMKPTRPGGTKMGTQDIERWAKRNWDLRASVSFVGSTFGDI